MVAYVRGWDAEICVSKNYSSQAAVVCSRKRWGFVFVAIFSLFKNFKGEGTNTCRLSVSCVSPHPQTIALLVVRPEKCKKEERNGRINIK